ncbi:alpha/beta fold hydrolase [Paenibacillus profundus]|uniref:Alpha/beta fold hydrolase n=1 Tax=Paenibacillus profundus TaxID=1173085 RepID=A0ABS8YDY9_9BACL|nr:alpha/beta fold hydrolase [Paenibacillus profundus]MCE5168653.1 alpha/beta fold hydrolase [Paenibacillus profundus]
MRHSFEKSWKEQRTLRGDVFIPEQQKKQGVLIITHGYKGFKDWGMFPYAAEQLAERSGLLTITFNFTYNGVGPSLDRFDEPERFAVNTYEREQEDLTALLQLITGGDFNEWLQQAAPGRRIGPEAPVYLLGHSRGGASCLLYALDHPEEIAGVITWNGVTNMDLFTAEQKHEMRTSGRSKVVNARTGEALPLDRVMLDDLEANRERYDLIGRTASASFPMALIQGSDDLPGFRDGSARLVASYPAAEWITIEGGGHTFNAVHPFQGTTPELEAALDATASWLQAQSR